MATAANASRTKVVKAAEAEAEDEMVSCEFEGEEYEYDSALLNDAEMLEAIDDNKLTHVIKQLIGQDGFDRYKTSGPKGRRKITDMQDFCKVLFEAAGTEAGK